MDVDEALKTRISIREFKDDPVPEGLIRDILAVARFSPSGGNLQPWQVIVVAGDEREAVSRLALDTLAKNPAGEEDEAPIYPPKLWEPYRSRRFKLGEDMYALLGIPRSDKPARLQRFTHNYRFFGAPIGLFFVIDRHLGRGQWAHLGMFMQSVALAATARGLGTCFQESWGMVRKTLHQYFELPEDQLLYCGMALGYADPEAAVNTLRSDRAEVDEFATFRGF
jgi:nitroreductase